VWNALRFGNFALANADEVKVFLIGSGVEIKSLDTDKFNVAEQLQTLIKNDGKVFVCGTCLETHQIEAPEAFKVSTLKDIHEIIKESDKVISF
jgi:uncharacterized protein involved in oxidation of intracellular sulfur